MCCARGQFVTVSKSTREKSAVPLKTHLAQEDVLNSVFSLMFQCFCGTISPLLRCSAVPLHCCSCSAAKLFRAALFPVPSLSLLRCFAASFRCSAALPCSTAPLFCCSAKPLLRCEIVPCGSLAPLLCCLVVLLRGCSPDTSPRYTIGPQHPVVPLSYRDWMR